MNINYLWSSCEDFFFNEEKKFRRKPSKTLFLTLCVTCPLEIERSPRIVYSTYVKQTNEQTKYTD